MNRAQRMLESADSFIEEHKCITLQEWNMILLEVEKENFDEFREKVLERNKEGKVPLILIEPEKIVETREALQVIKHSAERITYDRPIITKENLVARIKEQVKRINKLLPEEKK